MVQSLVQKNEDFVMKTTFCHPRTLATVALVRVTGVVAVVAAIFLLSGCADDQSDVTLPSEVQGNLKSLEYYKARQGEIQLVDLDTLAQTTNSILISEPNLSEHQLRDRLFDELRKLKEERDHQKRGIPSGPTIWGHELTWAEFWLLYWNSTNIIPTFQASQDAKNESQRQWTNMSGDDTKQDAFRHAYWNVLLAKRISLGWARDFSNAHESESKNQAAKRMDLHNNGIGRNEYSRYWSRSDAWFSIHFKNFTYIFHPHNFTGPFEYALTYFVQ